MFGSTCSLYGSSCGSNSSSSSSVPWSAAGIFPLSPGVSRNLRLFCLSCGHSDDLPGITGISWTGFCTRHEPGMGIFYGFLVLAIALISGDCCSCRLVADCVSTSSSMGQPEMIVAFEASLSLGMLITMGLNGMENR